VELDIAYVRNQFPQLWDNPDFVYCANAGGSYVAQPVLEALDYYNRHLRVQPYYGFRTSIDAGLAMDKARAGWCRALNICNDELTIGPSTSINSYVMAQALGANWKAGDEIVVSLQDHEANQGAFRRIAESRGASVREWQVDPLTGLLDPEDLFPLLNERTRWVFFTHCSNIIGSVNPVARIVAGIRQRSEARVGVDAVAYAPHHIADLKLLDVDMYMFSLYKVFGPHQGLLYLKAELQTELQPQCHYFVQEDSYKRFNPAGPQHAEVAACQGVLDYFDALYLQHDGIESKSPAARMQWLHGLIGAHERRLVSPLLDYLQRSSKVRLLGKPHCDDGDRAATIAFAPKGQSTTVLAAALQIQGIGVENGHFYAPRLLRSLDIEPSEGVVRISLVHYNTEEEVDKILSILEVALR
jgi:selenocysteine lyase/cysteine desulfurase